MMTMTDSAMRDKLVDALSSVKWTTIIDALRPNGTFTVNGLQEPFCDLLVEDKDKFLDILREAVYQVLRVKHPDIDIESTFSSMSIRLTADDTTPMHELNAREHENAIITFDCEVIGMAKVLSYIKECSLSCPKCYTEVHVKADLDKKLPNKICSNPSCKKQKMEVIRETAKTDNVQSISLQEPLETSRNQTPIILRGKIDGNLIGDVFIGQRKRITGVYRSEFDLKKDENEIIIEITNAEDLDISDSVVLSKEDINKIKIDSKSDGFIDKLIDSYAPHIFGMKDVKLACLLQLAGGTEGVKRPNINILLVGDPSMAKSEILKSQNIYSHRSMYTSGKGSSGVGLTLGLAKRDGEFELSAGGFVICDGGIICVDEFEKMDSYNRSAIHEPLEQGTCSIAKAGFKATFPARTSCLAAANPKFGKYDEEESLVTNIDLPPSLLSRFDFIWLIKDSINEQEDADKARHILNTYLNGNSEEVKYIDEVKFKGYLNHIRKLHPKITEETQSKILSIYKSMREVSSQKDSVGVGTRQLESIIRASTAHAKLCFRDTVLPEDVECVEELIKKEYQSFGFDLTGGTSSSQTSLVGLSKKETKEQTANRVWKEAGDKSGKVKLVEFVKLLGMETGFDEAQATKIFYAWEQQCIIKLNADNTYSKSGGF